MARPHCPECKSTNKPHSKITGLKGERVLLVYCSDCGCILGSVNYNQKDDGTAAGESGGGDSRDESQD